MLFVVNTVDGRKHFVNAEDPDEALHILRSLGKEDLLDVSEVSSESVLNENSHARVYSIEDTMFTA